MPDIEVIFDPTKELAAIVDVESRMGWGPAMIGPRAGEILQAFVDSVPFDVTMFDSYDAVRAFASFLERHGAPAPEGTSTPPVGPQEPVGGESVDGAPLAEHEAAHGPTEPPGPAPADADLEADQGQASQVINCPNCNGSGVISFGDETPDQACGMCSGSGKVTLAASA